MRAEPIGLYVHIPFCLKKCNYCDFCSYSDLDFSVRMAYVDALMREIRGYQKEQKTEVDTIFFGGGTPSLLEPREFNAICDAIWETFHVTLDAEFSIEANPKTLTEEKLSCFVARGVDRISMGLQSIHENELKILGRIHNFEDFKKSYSMVLDCGISNVGVDLMYGIPNQTVESFRETLDEVISLSPKHISAYSLILEEGTPLSKMQEELSFPSEDEECEMYELACERLSKCGYTHYEISNYSKPGFESRHNLKYWENKDFIGVGAAAYSCFGGRRYGNFSGLREYLSENPTQYITEEVHDSAASAYEFVMLGLRLKRGISLSEYKSLYKTDFLIGRREKISFFQKNGYLTFDGDRIALTEKGFYVSNAILSDLL